MIKKKLNKENKRKKKFAKNKRTTKIQGGDTLNKLVSLGYKEIEKKKKRLK